MISFLVLCLAATALSQQSTTQDSSQVEKESGVANPQPAAFPLPQRNYYNYQPAAQQNRPYYTSPRYQPESYSYSPYAFNYVAQGDDGSSSRQETGDASGRVVGSYTIAIEDGRRRVVDYVADQNGFRATVDTNEPGTDMQSPADVVFNSAAIDSRSNQGVYRPQNVYRPRPSRVYSRPNVISPVVYGGEGSAPYYQNYGYDQHPRHRGQAYTSYYNGNNRYSWQ